MSSVNPGRPRPGEFEWRCRFRPVLRQVWPARKDRCPGPRVRPRQPDSAWRQASPFSQRRFSPHEEKCGGVAPPTGQPSCRLEFAAREAEIDLASVLLERSFVAELAGIQTKSRAPERPLRYQLAGRG